MFHNEGENPPGVEVKLWMKMTHFKRQSTVSFNIKDKILSMAIFFFVC